MKKCNICGIEKSLSEFYVRTKNSDKHMAACKPCCNARTRTNYTEERSTKKGHAYQIFSRRKRQAKYKNVPFTIDFESIFELAPDVCPILGTQLNWGEKLSRPQPNSPSLDKIIPELGYIEGNVRWISYRANIIKKIMCLTMIRKILLINQEQNM